MRGVYSTLFGLLGLGAGVFASPSSGVNLPSSRSTVSVKVINSMIGRDFPPSLLVTPPIEGIYQAVPFYAFLVEHTGRDGRTQRVLFDAGIRGDVENSVPDVAASIRASGVNFDSATDVPAVLTANGVDLSSIDSVFWSHWHFDHVGDPAKFPKEVDIVVGPGFTQAFMPGYPTNPAASVFESALANRTVRELNFTSSRVNIGEFRALDWFGDGSFYIVDTPGHAIGHISALARTTPDTFVLMGGDVCHHPGELRPNEHTPLPREINPNPFRYLSAKCVGEFAQNIHPQKKRDQPFMHPSPGGFNLDVPRMEQTLSLVYRLDANPNVFTIIAHDETMNGTIDFFPKAVNDWKRRGWKDATRWAFIGQFEVS